jgi:ribosomal protein S18 acetylase RimI-like enzyme
MINVRSQVRRAVIADQLQIASLIHNEITSHRHLDWRIPLEWIGSPNYWVVEEDGRNITAVLACPEDPPQVAWIRLFAYSTHNSNSFDLFGLKSQVMKQPEAWSALWETARGEVLSVNPRAQVAAIAVKQWFQDILLSSGFELKQSIILLQMLKENARLFPVPHGIRVRPMREADLPAVVKVDLDAFGWFWHNSLDGLSRAFSQSVSATVAEDDSGVIGYQLSTGNSFGAHLARLGVKAEAQGRGVGAALVSGMIQSLEPNPLSRLSVNTQSDNEASLSLYAKLGFVRTGEQFPVFVYPANKNN